VKDCKIKFALYLRLWYKDIWEVDVKFHVFVTSALGAGKRSVSYSSFFTYGEKKTGTWVGHRTERTRLRGEQSSLMPQLESHS